VSGADPVFEAANAASIRRLGDNASLRAMSADWIARASRDRYSYHFTWLGLPVIQFPADLVAMQEIIWRVRPTLIIETGVARGGSLVFYASLLAMLGDGGRVIGVDVDIRPANRRAIEAHPLAGRIELVQGDSTAGAVVQRVQRHVRKDDVVLVALDSNHAHAHVLAELGAYAPLVTSGSYLVVFDTIIEELPAGYFADRPWDKGSNPSTAIAAFLAECDDFQIDEHYASKLLISAASGGYLRRR
jgi:cephalosporin hydroxylase